MMRTDKKRVTILLGAGAVIDWSAPTTNELTILVRETGFFCIDNNTRITEFIYQALLKNHYEESQINFETIINVIEELAIHYSYFESNGKIPSLSKVFFQSKFEKELLNFSISSDGVEKHGFHLDIPVGQYYEWQHSGAINGESPHQMFFYQLLAHLLTVINKRVSKYAYHSEGNSKVITKENIANNELFIEWIKNLNNSNSIIRLYTLNYDRLFKILSLRSGVSEMFEGFECNEVIDASSIIKPNILRIITDVNCHCHYNLHGSVFWTINTRDETRLINHEIYLKGSPELQLSIFEQSNIQVEKGKPILLSNIITGYQKAQKGFLTPFKQMQASFDKDCIIADELYVIGYSFGDEHINMSIKTALRYNEKLKIILVDPIYDESNGKKGYDILVDRFIKVFTTYLSNRGDLKKINNSCCEYFDGKIRVYTLTMKEFLRMQIKLKN